jgi:Fic-DOC domain mobile mystery protein B
LNFQFLPGATFIDLDEAEGLIPSLSTQAELNEFEALNILEAMEWAGRNRRLQAQLLTQEGLKLLHRRMFDRTWRWAGRFRTTQKSIGVEAWSIPTSLKSLLDDVACWQEFETYVPEEICVRFHHRLVAIHPFANGNGRHARLAAELLAARYRLRPFTWGSANLSNVGDVRRCYLESLYAADRHDHQQLMAFVRS